MPRGERDYSKTKIYEIVCNETEERYVGSTVSDYLCQRLAGHKNAYNQWVKGKHSFITCFPILKRNNYTMTLLEKYPCNDADERHAREGHWIRKLDCVNKNIAGRSQKEYYEENKEDILRQQKEYHEANKEYIHEYQKEYRETNKERIKNKKSEKVLCECGCQVTRQNISTHQRSNKHKKLLEEN
jgi:hypothetical protein